jgi:hypothetical protein
MGSMSRILAVAAATAGLALLPAVASAAPGDLDSSFGSGGLASAPSGTQLYGVAVDAHENSYAVGTAGGNIFAERLDPAGAVTATYTGPAGVARGVAIAPNGDVVIAGSSGGAMIAQELSPALAAAPVWSATAFGGQSAQANGVAVAADGSAIVVGAHLGSVGTESAVAEFTPTGGLRWTQVGIGNGDHGSQLNAVALQPGGSIVVGGAQFTNNGQTTNGLVAQLSAAGAVQHAGLVYYPGSGYVSLNAAATQADGQVVLAGVSDNPVVVVVRLTTAGAFDSTFGSSPAAGYPSLAAAPSGQNVSVSNYPFGGYGVGIAAGSRVLASGNWEQGGAASDQALWAFTPAGQSDSGLTGGNGTTSRGNGTVTGPDSTYESCGMAVDPVTGNIVSVGDTITSFPARNPCGLSSYPASNAGQGFVSRLIGFGAPSTSGGGGGSGSGSGGGTQAPSATTGATRGVTEVGATLLGSFSLKGVGGAYAFQLGLSPAYGRTTARRQVSAGAVQATQFISGLRPGTTYHYRLVVSTAGGTAFGADRTFRTAQALRLGISGLPKKLSHGNLDRFGLRSRVSCDQACTVNEVLTLVFRSGKRLIRIRLGTARMSEPSGGRMMTLRLSKAGAKALRSHPFGQLRLNLTAAPKFGGPRRSLYRTLQLTR